MSPTLELCFRSWPLDPGLLVTLALALGLYLRGWLKLRTRDRRRWNIGHLAAFLGSLAAIGLALASPIEPLAGFLLWVHMVQHLLLMMLAPPLLWLANPLFPLLSGLPEPVRIYWARPLLRSHRLRRWLAWLAHPRVALPVYVAVTWLWHVPRLYESALRSTAWHYGEHVCFLAAALLFWYPVVRPYPSRPRWSRWLLIPYLIAADVQNTVLSAIFAFAAQPLYPYYSDVPRLGGLSALEDQRIAGVLMWVPGSVAFLLPMFVIGVRLLYGPSTAQRRQWRRFPAVRPIANGEPVTLTVLSSFRPAPAELPRRLAAARRHDLLRAPLIGRALQRRHARLALQVPMFLLAGLVIWDGLTGPQVSAMNLAGVLPWIHWRGLLVFGLLVAGNLFCLACPFTLPRWLARKLLPAGFHWPRALRTKWLAVLLMLLFLWAYEAFALWDSPWWTAWIAIAYFVAALVVDGMFRGAAFCKYVCPIGQFNFVQSLVSPLTVQVRESSTCATCRTHECIQGGSGIPGCELELFQPRKQGNMDCTFCLDCVHACPHDNVGLIAALPGRELWSDPWRSGIGRFSRRTDLAALVLVIVFGAFANAAGMVGPVVDWENDLQVRLGWQSPFWIIGALSILALIVFPVAAVAGCAALSRRCGGSSEPWLRIATRYVYALVPLGFAMWIAHYSFHLLTSCAAVVPAAERFAADLGLSLVAPASWQAACCQPAGNWLPRLEILLLDAGLLVSLYASYRIALSQTSGFTARSSTAWRACAPWALLTTLLFAFGVWIVLQPMQMRGTLAVDGARQLVKAQ